jgi:hypothetical protein
MTKTYLKILLLAFPLLGMAFLEAVVLPKDYFTYRAWEALKINFFTENLPGSFYPLAKMTKWEALDRNPRGPRIRQNEWITDMYGNRNRALPEKGERYGVIIGDSNIAGASYSQNEIFSERLTRQTGVLWINLNYEYFEPWNHPLCRKYKPDYLIYQLKRGYLIDLPKMSVRAREPVPGSHKTTIAFDHATKVGFLNKMRSFWGAYPIDLKEQCHEPHTQFLKSIFSKIIFGDAKKRLGDIEFFQKSKPCDTLIDYAKRCNDLGIFFVILVLPDQVRAADSLIEELKTSGCHVIGFLPSDAYPDGADLKSFWQKDDSHWSVLGMEKCVSEIRLLLSKHKMF